MYSLIIVDYNSLEKTIEYTGHCWQAMGSAGAAHVVIVQNGEPEREWELLEEAFGAPSRWREPSVEEYEIYRYDRQGQQILYCHSGENMGYARGNNLGIQIARAAWQDPYYLVSNNDLVFERLMDLSVIDEVFSSHPEVGVIGPKVVTPAGEQQSPRRWLRPFDDLVRRYWISMFGGIFGGEKKKKWAEKYCNDILTDAPSGEYAWVSGCFLFLRAAAFEQAGMFDPYTFLYGEEMILSKRMEAAGYSVYFCPEVNVIHQHGQTTKTVLSALRGIELAFDTSCYFYGNYGGASKGLITFARGNFRIFAFLYRKLKKG